MSFVQNLPFQKVQHRVDTTDAQPSNETGGILVMVTGALMVSAQPHCPFSGREEGTISADEEQRYNVTGRRSAAANELRSSL